MIDSHVHLNRREFGDELPDLLARAEAAGVAGFLNVGYDLATSRESIALAESDPRILATVGIHPHDAEEIADAQGNATSEGGISVGTKVVVVSIERMTLKVEQAE